MAREDGEIDEIIAAQESAQPFYRDKKLAGWPRSVNGVGITRPWVPRHENPESGYMKRVQISTRNILHIMCM